MSEKKCFRRPNSLFQCQEPKLVVFLPYLVRILVVLCILIFMDFQILETCL